MTAHSARRLLDLCQQVGLEVLELVITTFRNVRHQSKSVAKPFGALPHDCLKMCGTLLVAGGTGPLVCRFHTSATYCQYGAQERQSDLDDYILCHGGACCDQAEICPGVVGISNVDNH